MQIVKIAPHTASKLFWSGVAGLGFVMLVTADQSSPMLLAASFLLALLGIFPIYVWLLGRSHGLPIWPAFAAYSGLLAALPVVQGSKSMANYSADAVLGGLLVMVAFLGVGSLVWITMTAKSHRPPKNVLMLESGSAVRSLFVCLGIGLLFQANNYAGWIVLPGNTMQIFRGIAGGLSYLGVFALAYFYGAGKLNRLQVGCFCGLFALLLFISLTGIMLATAIPYVALALIGLTLGAGRVPWLVLLGFFLFITLLHSGKYKMRELYFDAEGGRSMAKTGLADLPGLYAEWFGYGFETLGGLGHAIKGGVADDAPSSVFERAGNLHMLLLVLEKTPREVPYLNGITYEPIPQMLIPRFLSPEKTISHIGNVILSINYGLLDEEGALKTSIGWSLVAEAYANFGYVGVMLLAAALAALYSEVTRLSAGVPITSLRFITGLIVLAGVTNENSLGVFITMQFQGVVGVALASFFIMRRHPNPLAEETAIGDMRQKAEAGSRTAEVSGGQKSERGVRSAQGGVRRAEIGDQRSEVGGGRSEGLPAVAGGAQKAAPKLTILRPKTAAGMPRRAAPWMTPRMRKQIAAQNAADDGAAGQRGSET